MHIKQPRDLSTLRLFFQPRRQFAAVLAAPRHMRAQGTGLLVESVVDQLVFERLDPDTASVIEFLVDLGLVDGTE